MPTRNRRRNRRNNRNRRQRFDYLGGAGDGGGYRGGGGSADPSEILNFVKDAPENDLRGAVFPLPRTGLHRNFPLFDYQKEVVERVTDRYRWGIVHLPTGAGKTRIGMEIAARRLAEDPKTLVIWATDKKVVLRQAMVRAVELGDLFPRGTRAVWLTGPQANDTALNQRVVEEASLVFVTRRGLTTWLERLRDMRRNACGLYDALEGDQRRPVLVIYDECHELGAEGLRDELLECMDRYQLRRRRRMFQLVGLSATPIPNNGDAQEAFRARFFPMYDGDSSARPEWEMHVFSSIGMRELTDRGVLCPIDTAIHDTGIFDISNVAAEAAARFGYHRFGVRAGGRLAKKEVYDFFNAYNRSVMSDREVMATLAKRVGDNLHRLGKTIVYCATIKAANEFVAVLRNNPAVGRGRVTVVHSRMDELEPGDGYEVPEGALDAHQQLARFVARGDEPCVLVNVGMATVGFDDPKVKTIVLARLTHSRNLFWQMIGRGLRGPKVGGTPYCNVIDPVRLTDELEMFEGYRPDLRRGGLPDEDLEAREAAEIDIEELAPVVQATEEAFEGAEPQPEPSIFDRRVRQEAGKAAVEFFADGAPEPGGVVAKIAQILGFRWRDRNAPEEAGTQAALPTGALPPTPDEALRWAVRDCEQHLGVELPWLWNYLPRDIESGEQLQEALTMVRFVRDNAIRDEDTFLEVLSSVFG